MKARIIIFLIFVVLIVVGGTYLIKKNNEYINSNIEENTLKEDEAPGINIKDLVPIEKGEENQDKEKIKAQIANNEKLFLYFYTTWCPMCQKTEPIMADLMNKYPDILVIQIDSDVEKELKDEYDVHNVPTIILIEKNKEVDRIVEITNADKIEEFLTK